MQNVEKDQVTQELTLEQRCQTVQQQKTQLQQFPQ